MLRALGFAVLTALALASCAPKPPPPLPIGGPIIYDCADGSQLQVTFQGNQALVAIVGSYSMALPNAGPDYYSNGRYGIRGSGRSASWEVGRAAPVTCEGH
ncbi:MAG: hypothetical protein AB7O04_07140 [Hyphomonadaceae bacterium]